MVPSVIAAIDAQNDHHPTAAAVIHPKNPRRVSVLAACGLAGIAGFGGPAGAGAAGTAAGATGGTAAGVFADIIRISNYLKG